MMNGNTTTMDECTKFQHDWQNDEDAMREGVLVVFQIFFFFLKEFLERTRSKDEVQKGKQGWKI